jgi:hypothetical protein
MVRLFCFSFSDDCFVPDLKVPQNIDEKFSLIKQYLEGMLLVSNIFSADFFLEDNIIRPHIQ